MKQILAVLLLSFGVYSFAFGLYLAVTSLEIERMEKVKKIVYPEGQSEGTALKADPVEKYPLGLFLLSASGTTFGLWSGVHLLFRSKAAKKKKKT